MRINRVCILGGSGFVGQHLVARLAADHIACRVVTRHPERHRELQVLPGVELVAANLFDPQALTQMLSGCQAVINLVGILNESGRHATFDKLHVGLVEAIAQAAPPAGVRRFLQMSGLNADAGQGVSRYLRSKGAGEEAAHRLAASGIQVTSFRPSVIFGRGDSFFNRFATLLSWTPGIFPLACPKARLAPVFVGDVVEAMARALSQEEAAGQRYDLCGPAEYSLLELVRYTARLIGWQGVVIGLPAGLSWFQAALLGLAPGRPFTRDNYRSLQVPSVCRHNGLTNLGIEPTAIQTEVPPYLAAASERDRYLNIRATLPEGP